MLSKTTVEFVLSHLDGRVFAKTNAGAFKNLTNLWPWAKLECCTEFECELDDVTEEELDNGFSQIRVRGNAVATFCAQLKLKG